MAAIIKHAKNDSTKKPRGAAEQTVADVESFWPKMDAQARQRMEQLNEAFSLPLEKALVASDYEVLRQLPRSEMMAGLSRLEEKISEGVATSELETLRRAGCSRQVLLWLLHWLSNEPIFPLLKNWLYEPGVRTVERLFGITPKQLEKLVTQVNDVATQVEKVNRNFEFGILLSVAPLDRLWNLSHLLRVYAKLLQDGARHFGRGSDIYHNIAKARLTTYVENRTGNFYDKEVAALVSSVSGKGGYDETSHRVWRNKHYARLKTVDPLLARLGKLLPQLPEG
ncbi:MAG: hypothetical protein ABSC64_14190 [Candidatus Korobacteraceae bacterium]